MHRTQQKIQTVAALVFVSSDFDADTGVINCESPTRCDLSCQMWVYSKPTEYCGKADRYNMEGLSIGVGVRQSAFLFDSIREEIFE